MMAMDREYAWRIVCEFVKSDSLRKHILGVEASMRHYALLYGEDEKDWGIVGLLHDFDWEIHPTLEQHPHMGAPILRERGVAEDIVQSILSHAPHTGVPRLNIRDSVLYACDELTGLITAVALVRPNRSIHDVKVSSVRKKWKSKAFASGVNRADIEQGTSELGIDLWVHVQNVIDAMQSVAVMIGLQGDDKGG